MHAVLITFTSSAPLSDLHAPFSEYAEALTGVPGLIMKTWIHDGSTVGGFHLFESRAAADRYLGGDLCATVLNNPSFGAFEVRHFDVIDDFKRTRWEPGRTLVRVAPLMSDRRCIRIDRVPQAAPRLRESERRVAVLVAEGLTNRQVADQLFVSVKTVEFHLSAIYRRLGIHNRTELARMIGRSSLLIG